MKGNKGITLIALVITIIVLLILAAATLSYFMGESGLFPRAYESKRQNEFAIVKDTIMLKMQENAFLTYKGETQDAIILLLDEDYVDYDYKVNMDKINQPTLEMGHGTIETGDYYSLKDDKLTYIDENKNEIEIVSLNGLGKIPVNLYFSALPDETTVNMQLNGEKLESSFEIKLKNYDNDLVTREDVNYEIQFKNKEDSLVNTSIEGIDLNNENYSASLAANQKVDQTLKVNINPKDNKVFSKTTIYLDVIVKSPSEYKKTIKITVTNDILLDSSSNKNNATLKDGAKIAYDNGNNSYIELDGTNYVLLPTISSSFNFEKGFTIESVVEIDEFNGNSTILNLGNGIDSSSVGEDHIIVQLVENEEGRINTVKFEAQGKGPFGAKDTHKNYPENNSIEAGVKTNISTTISKDIGFYSSKIYIQEENEASKRQYSATGLTTIRPIKDVGRTQNYIGKSYWNKGDYFKGKIYYLKMTDSKGNVVFEFDLNKN